MSCIDAQHAPTPSNVAAPTDAPRYRGEPIDGGSSSSAEAGWAVVNRHWAPHTDRVGGEGGGGCSELLPSSCCLRRAHPKRDAEGGSRVCFHARESRGT